MKIQNILLWVLFALIIAFILAFTICYTLDFHYHTKLVGLLTLCRVALLIVGIVYLWTVRQNLSRLVDAISITVGCIIVAGAISGLLNDSNWRSYFVHGFQYSSLLVSYLVGRDLACHDIPKRFFIILFSAIVAGYTIATMFYVATPGLHSGSYSFQPNLALLPLAYNGNAIMSVASAVLILFGNKRAVFIGGCFCVATLAVLIGRRKGGFSLPVQTISIFVLAPVIALGTVSILSTLQIPLVKMVGERISSSPSFIDTDTNLRISDSGPQKAGSPPRSPAEQNVATERNNEFVRKEATVDPWVRWTGARNVEVKAIQQLLSSQPTGTLFGVGFGSTFEMDYISPNDYGRVNYTREQADVMLAHIAMTSGIPLSILFTALLVVAFWRMFTGLDALQDLDRTFALFSISLFVDIMTGFNGTNAAIWSSIGYATMRSLNPGIASK